MMLNEKELLLEYVSQRIEDFESAYAVGITSGSLVMNGHTLKDLFSLVPKELKLKKDIPTVIEYQGRRYVLDHANNRH
jgi:hypothetical protein